MKGEDGNMEFHFLGGAMEIGASCIYVKAAGKRFLFDSGIRQSGGKDPLPDFRTIQDQGGVDAMIVSHAHMDHIGTLPIISKAYPDARIYMTVMTAELTRVLLYDSLKIMAYREDEIPHYTEQDVLDMLGRITPVRYQTEQVIADDVRLTFYPAGHIAGAACAYLATEEGTLFYSGDFAAFSQRTIEGIHIPKLRPDVAIVETTYGNRLHANRQVEERRLVELVRECVESGQKVLIPAFALGRSQEVLLILRAAIQNGEIPAVPVYVDGMVRDINIVYTRNPTFLKNALGKRILRGGEPFYTKEIQPVAPMENREELLDRKGAAVIVSSSGMLTGGPSMQYAKKLVQSDNACVIITGYQDEESPGRQLMNLLEGQEERKITLDGTTLPVKCRIEQVGLSAHGDKSEITALLERLSARKVFLVHGNAETIRDYGKELVKEDYRRHIYLPECGQVYDVEIRKKRRQLDNTLPCTMQKPHAFTAEDGMILWEYWREHYSGRKFPVSQLAVIWYGRQQEEEVLQKMQEILAGSPYFSQNARQLFLFEANSQEDIEKALAPREQTIQDVEIQIQEIFAAFTYRKIGYYPERREAVLQFDYPDSIDRVSFQKGAGAFQERTGWTISVNPSMNHSAAGSMLYAAFGDRLQKVSYYVERKQYAVTVSAAGDGDSAAAEAFFRQTGWHLCVNGKCLSDAGAEKISAVGNDAAGEKSDMEFVPRDASMHPTEQNLAFSCIEQNFDSFPDQIEKKSIRQDERGKYLEFSFVSPVVGLRYREILQETANQIGWRIRIADKVNQNALFQVVRTLCAEHGVVLARNPSYISERRTVVVKTTGDADVEQREAVAEVFLKKTGCACEFV
ncbi:MAG: MBL fold metallo-hydrolase [Lachnospiraceae bacterium]|nr:MBL fold metallo-hydrolase [Lachnospiraceae bacterium]